MLNVMYGGRIYYFINQHILLCEREGLRMLLNVVLPAAIMINCVIKPQLDVKVVHWWWNLRPHLTLLPSVCFA